MSLFTPQPRRAPPATPKPPRPERGTRGVIRTPQASPPQHLPAAAKPREGRRGRDERLAVMPSKPLVKKPGHFYDERGRFCIWRGREWVVMRYGPRNAFGALSPEEKRAVENARRRERKRGSET